MTVEGYKHFIDAESMSAFDVNAFLMSQAVTRFDTAADRDAALEQVVTEGMVSYNKDTGELQLYDCLLYTSPSPRDGLLSRMPSSA